MGCDIHLHTEVKIKGVWHHYSAPSIDRNYRLFEKMAGVRGAGQGICHKGLPGDMTELTRYCAEVNWGSAGHTHGWLSAKQITQLVEWVKEQDWNAPKDKDRAVLPLIPAQRKPRPGSEFCSAGTVVRQSQLRP